MKKFTESGIRKPAVAGSFYPSNEKELKLVLAKFFERAEKIKEIKNVKALIVPHAGYVYSGQTAAWGYKQLTPIENQHFVLVGPSHNYFFDGLVFSDFSFWETPLGLAKQRLNSPDGCKNPPPVGWKNLVKLYNEPHIPEHCLEVQLPFLQALYDKFSFTGFLTGQNVDIKKSARYFLDNYTNSIFIISSDLSHYLPYDQANKKDQTTVDHILNLDSDFILSGDNVACGNTGIAILIEMAKLRKWQGKLVNYDTSATASGDKSAVVGYAAIGFYK